MLPTILFAGKFRSNVPPSSLPDSSKTESTLARTIAQVGSHLMDCFLNRVEHKTDPREVLLLHPKKVQETLKELKEAKPQNSPNTIEHLANKINTLVQSFWDAYQIEDTIPELEPALLSLNLLAKNLKEASPMTEILWKKLSPDVQKMFNKAVNLQEAPQMDCLRLRWCHSTASLPISPITACFEDGAVFLLKKRKDFVGLTSYSLPNHPNFHLYHTGSLPNLTLQLAQTILKTLPAKMSDVFNIEPVLKKFYLNSQCNQPIACKYLHQLLSLRNAYFNGILSALGIEVLRPQAMGSMGEWSIFCDEGPEYRSLAGFHDWKGNAVLLKSAVEAITNVLRLEKNLGLKLLKLPEGSDTDTSVQSLFLVSGKHTIPGTPLEKIEFIENIQNRLEHFKSLLEKHFTPELVKQVEWEKFSTISGSDESCAFLKCLIAFKILSYEDLKYDSENLLSLLQAYQEAILKNPTLYKKIPWEKFKDVENLKLYLELIAQAPKELAEPSVLLEHSYCLAKKIIIDMPKHLVETQNNQATAKLNYEEVVSNFISDKNTLHTFIVTYILSSYQNDPDASFKDHFKKLFDSDSAKSEDSLYNKLCKRLNEEGSSIPSLNPAKWILKGSEKPCTPGEYFGTIFWEECVENLQTSLNVPYEQRLEDPMAILRTAFINANTELSKAAIHTQVMEVLHHHMLKAENHRQIQELKERLRPSLSLWAQKPNNTYP